MIDMNDKPIGVFDSGLGGLTVMREIRRALPGEDIVYFGDTGRVPYGTRSNDTILKYALQDIRFLRSFDIKMIVVACGTVSSVLSEKDLAQAGVPVMTIIEPTARQACALSKTGKIGVIGTTATIRSGSYERAIAKLRPDASVTVRDCPLFVPLVECGFALSECAALVCETYLREVRRRQVDTLILGCTHYPMLKDSIGKVMGSGVHLIDSGESVSIALADYLEKAGMLSSRKEKGTVDYYVSDSIENFGGVGEAILGEPILDRVKKIDIELY